MVRADDPAQTLADLRGYRILLGPADEAEKHAAASAALASAGIALATPQPTRPGCNAAALAIVDKHADAAVISSYAYPLLEGCGTIDRGALRVVGRTAGVPFVTLFVTARVSPTLEGAVLAALAAVADEPSLLRAMESKGGFVRLGGEGAPPGGWPDWRGMDRDGLSRDLPTTLPATARLLWQRALSGNALAGVAASAGLVVVADKSSDQTKDIWRGLNADTGEEVWTVSCEAAGEMDFGNAPRATPVLRDGLAYLLGAFGDLHCVNLENGRGLWRQNLISAFGGRLPTWGTCSTPLLVDDLLIVNPGAPEAALVALDRHDGSVVWKTPGKPAAYSSFIVGRFGGVRQVVGYDAVSLGGWDVRTGKRLWQLVPPQSGDFNVGTPVDVGGRLLVATENNGTRLYGFSAGGALIAPPLAENAALAPDTATPIVLDGLVIGVSGQLVCLDLEDGLKTLWTSDDRRFADYATLIGGGRRALITTMAGELLLIEPAKGGWSLLSSLRVLGAGAEVWSHPALVAGRLYLRSQDVVCCVLLGPDATGVRPVTEAAVR